MLKGGLYQVIQTGAPQTNAVDTVAININVNQTLGTNLSGTLATAHYTIAAPPVDGLVKEFAQTGTGAAQILAAGSAPIYNGTTLVATSVNIATVSGCTLLGLGGAWYVTKVTGTVTFT